MKRNSKFVHFLYITVKLFTIEDRYIAQENQASNLREILWMELSIERWNAMIWIQIENCFFWVINIIAAVFFRQKKRTAALVGDGSMRRLAKFVEFLISQLYSPETHLEINNYTITNANEQCELLKTVDTFNIVYLYQAGINSFKSTAAVVELSFPLFPEPSFSLFLRMNFVLTLFLNNCYFGLIMACWASC